jgi:hypothetical protein
MTGVTRAALTLCASSVVVIGLQAVPAHAATSTGPSAAIAGALGVDGGAYPGKFRPTAGTVEVEFTNVPLVLVHQVGASGKFDIKLSPGKYSVVGCGPSSSGNQCSQSQNVTLVKGQIDHLKLVWAHLP